MPHLSSASTLHMPPETVKRTILIDGEDYRRFRERHPSHGAFTWFIRTALKKYNELNDTDPEELVQLAVGDLITPPTSE